MYVFWLSIVIAVLFALGDSSATKYFESQHQRWWMILGVGLNALGVIVLWYVAHKSWLGVSSGTILTINILLNVLFGVLYFGDRLSPMQYVGLAFGILGIVILSYY